MLDCEGQLDDELWFDVQSSLIDRSDDEIFYEVSVYRFRRNCRQLFFFDAESFKDHNLDGVFQSFNICNRATTKTNDPEHELL